MNLMTVFLTLTTEFYENENVWLQKTSVIIVLTADIKDVQERMKKASSWTKSTNELKAPVKEYESDAEAIADYNRQLKNVT